MAGGSGRGGARILFYSQDGLGLGHLRRTSAIAGALARALPGTALLVAADSPAGQFFGSVPGQDHLKLPSIRKLGPGDWQPISLPLGFGEVHELRRSLLRTAALRFRPDLLLVDHMPHGAMGELLPTLSALRRVGATRVVLGLRDILDAPEVIGPVWRREGAMAALTRHYDRVLVYGRREVFDVADRYGFPPGVASRLRYTGYLCTDPRPGGDPADAEAPWTLAAAGPAWTQAAWAAERSGERAGAGASRPLVPRRTRPSRIVPGGGAPERALLLAMVGGGADGYPVLRAVLDALPAVDAVRPCRAMLVTGPFMPHASRQELERRARGLHVRVHHAVRHLPSLLAAADVTVCMAGYNTSVEVLRAGTPAVLVPRARPSAEQRTRAGLFADRGWVRTTDPDRLDPGALAAAVLACLGRGGSGGPMPGPDLGGLGATVAHLCALLRGDEEPAPGRPPCEPVLPAAPAP
ncbi:MAG TPA: glycosyltransferase [Actinomycetes bacterium]|nr:glycosyltransferase [Actinomycetes bacterium]